MSAITITLIIIGLAIVGSLAFVHIHAQIQDYKDTLSDTDNRKSFGYCPIDSDTTTILTKYGVTYSIESCPLSRVYVENWDKIDDTTKQAIVSELENNGYRIESE